MPLRCFIRLSTHCLFIILGFFKREVFYIESQVGPFWR